MYTLHATGYKYACRCGLMDSWTMCIARHEQRDAWVKTHEA